MRQTMQRLTASNSILNRWQHTGLPYVDSEPPYEWFCNISEMNGESLTTLDGPQPLGVNKMIRARVFDKSK